MIHHASLPVRDLARSTALYDAALGALGYRRVVRAPGFAGYGIEDGKDKLALIQISTSVVSQPGLHLALAAPSRDTVDRFLDHRGSAIVLWQNGHSLMLTPNRRPDWIDPGTVGMPEIDSVTFERGRPEPLDRRGHPKYVAGEMCHTLNFHWGVAEKDFNYLSPAHVFEELCGCRRAGARPTAFAGRRLGADARRSNSSGPR